MNEISSKTHALLTLSMLKGVGPASLKKVSQQPIFGKVKISELLEYLPRGISENISVNLIENARAEADRQVDRSISIGARIISGFDAEYPKLLSRTKDDPQILFVKGKLAEDAEKSITVIGTREPTEHGKIIVDRITSFFVSEGWSIVSGLALGCDALAHAATISTEGHTVAVLAHGLHTIAPKRHQKLADKIIDTGGALVTEYKFDQEPMPNQFVKRDRIQSGFSQGVVMVQSDVVGGSLHASRAAIEYGRWLAVPYPTEQDISRKESKIQANLRLADGSVNEKIELLKCNPADLNRLVIIRGKSDYTTMLKNLEMQENSAPNPPIQESLF